MIGYLQNIPKNQSFNLTFAISNTDEQSTSANTIKISKDGGAFVNTTNSPVLVAGTGVYSVTLTATEMNANIIVLQANDSAVPTGITNIIIYTTATTIAAEVWAYSTRVITGGGISFDDIIDDQADLPSGNLTVRQVLELLTKRFKRSGRGKI